MDPPTPAAGGLCTEVSPALPFMCLTPWHTETRQTSNVTVSFILVVVVVVLVVMVVMVLVVLHVTVPRPDVHHWSAETRLSQSKTESKDGASPSTSDHFLLSLKTKTF